MQQHPVPQNISSYEFRLVGDMTLKQFFQLAGGFLVAFILYKTPLVGILKWPLMFISGLTGVLMAFVPVNGRPFSQWILAFIHAIYSPTRFVWNPAKTIFTFTQPTLPNTENRILDTKSQTPLDRFESQLFSRFSDLFAGKNPFANTQPSTLNTQPQDTKVQDSMINPSASSGQVTQTVIIDKPILPPQPTPTPPPPPPPPAVTPPVVPTNYEPTNQLTSSPTPLTPIFSHSPISSTQYSEKSAQKPVTSNTPMQIPETPNIISGVVTNAQNASIESAIIEITDTATGIPVRALRTNKLGQFRIATPVGNGKYQITTEKEGLNFETLTFEANGKIINPIQIIASGQSSQLVSS